MSPTPDNRGARPHRGRLGLLGLIAVIYLIVSGGAYGMEDAVRMAGPRLALLLCIIVPLTLSLPTALMAAELTALMPVEGGFYVWVKEAFGPFAGFLEAYLTLLYTAVDMAIYPVLFTAYLSFLYPLGVGEKIAVGIALVWCAGLLNAFGIRVAGNAAIVMTAILLAPFIAMVTVGFGRIAHWQLPTGHLFGHDFAGALGAGLTVVIWNFSGWENASVVAGETEHAGRNYVRAIAATIPLVALGYLIPLAVSLSGSAGGPQWTAGWFSHVGREIGGAWLGAAVAIGGTVSAFAVFEAGMLWVSRMPFVLAKDGYLPRGLATVAAATGSPNRSIFWCCVVYSMLVPLGFVTLVVLDVFFYMFALVLEMGALIRLRAMYPDRRGRFRIGGGRAGLYLVALAPTLTWLATFGLVVARGGIRIDFIIGIALAATVWPVYLLCRRVWGGPVETADLPATSIVAD